MPVTATLRYKILTKGPAKSGGIITTSTTVEYRPDATHLAMTAFT
jgi:hypothetical protein